MDVTLRQLTKRSEASKNEDQASNVPNLQRIDETKVLKYDSIMSAKTFLIFCALVTLTLFCYASLQFADQRTALLTPKPKDQLQPSDTLVLDKSPDAVVSIYQNDFDKLLNEIVDTSKWLQYTNDDIGIRFKVPSDWNVQQEPGQALTVYPPDWKNRRAYLYGDNLNMKFGIFIQHVPDPNLLQPNSISDTSPNMSSFDKTLFDSRILRLEHYDNGTRLFQFVIEDDPNWAIVDITDLRFGRFRLLMEPFYEGYVTRRHMLVFIQIARTFQIQQ